MKYTLVDYKGQHSSRKPRIRMLTSGMWWSKGTEYNVQYETQSEKFGRSLYINDETDGIAVVNAKDEGTEFEWVRDAKDELKKALARIEEA